MTSLISFWLLIAFQCDQSVITIISLRQPIRGQFSSQTHVPNHIVGFSSLTIDLVFMLSNALNHNITLQNMNSCLSYHDVAYVSSQF